MSAQVLPFPRANQISGATSLATFIRQHLLARADQRLRDVPDHGIAPATDAADAAVTRVMRENAGRIAETALSISALIEELDAEARS